MVILFLFYVYVYRFQSFLFNQFRFPSYDKSFSFLRHLFLFVSFRDNRTLCSINKWTTVDLYGVFVWLRFVFCFVLLLETNYSAIFVGWNYPSSKFVLSQPVFTHFSSSLSSCKLWLTIIIWCTLHINKIPRHRSFRVGRAWWHYRIELFSLDHRHRRNDFYIFSAVQSLCSSLSFKLYFIVVKRFI